MAQLQRALKSPKMTTPSHHIVAADPYAFKAKPEQPAKSSFGQDFVLEHCMSGCQTASGETPNPFRDLQNSPQSYGFPC